MSDCIPASVVWQFAGAVAIVAFEIGAIFALIGARCSMEKP